MYVRVCVCVYTCICMCIYIHDNNNKKNNVDKLIYIGTSLAAPTMRQRNARVNAGARREVWTRGCAAARHGHGVSARTRGAGSTACALARRVCLAPRDVWAQHWCWIGAPRQDFKAVPHVAVRLFRGGGGIRRSPEGLVSRFRVQGLGFRSSAGLLARPWLIGSGSGSASIP